MALKDFNVVAIIQARLASTRLPGKVLADIEGMPMLEWVVERTRRAHTLRDTIVATTQEPEDEAIAEFCTRKGIACYRGHQHDVLDRYYRAAKHFQAQVVVRITADCPLIDPQVIDLTVGAFLGCVPFQDGWMRLGIESTQVPGRDFPDQPFPYDFVTNRLPPPWGRTFPIGLDVEVCSFAALETAWREAKEAHQREHVMPFFYDNPQRFRMLLLNHERNLGTLRWTVDTPQDLELVRQICASFPGRTDFSWLEVVALFERFPHLAQINAAVSAKDYRQVDERLHR